MSLTLGAAAILGGSALLSGLLSSSSASRQNKIAVQQFDDNMRFQKYQYEDSKRYNSIPNQVKQIRQSGMNPSLLYGSGFSGTSVSQVGGVAPTASRQPVDFSYIPSAASSMLSALNETELVESQKDLNYSGASKNMQESIGQSIKNQYEHGNQRLAQYFTRMQGQLAETETAYQMMTMDARVEQAYWQGQLSRAEAGSRLVAAAWAPVMHKQEYQQLLANVAAAVATKQLTYQQANEVLMATIAKYGMSKKDAMALFNNSVDLVSEQVNTEKAKQSQLGRSGSFTGLGTSYLQKVHDKWQKKYGRSKTAKMRSKVSRATGGVR